MDDLTKFEHLVQVRVPTNLAEAIDAAAKRRCQSRSDYVRQSIVDRLRFDSVQAGQSSKSAGELYDCVDGGKSRFALVVGDEIAGMSYCEEIPRDGRRWLRVVHADSEPFDILRHWRLTPRAQIDGDRVVVTFPVVLKTVENA